MTKRVIEARFVIETNDDGDTTGDPYYNDHEITYMIGQWFMESLSDRMDHPKIVWGEISHREETVDGIRPHRFMTGEQMDLQRRVYEAMPVDTGEINIVRGRE